MKRGALSVEALTKRFGDTTVLDRLDLSIAAGSFMALLGPSGSGKTTLLRLIAGFEAPEGGRVVLDGDDLSAVPAYARPVNLVFQSYALFPHMTVAGNIAFGLRREGVAGAELQRRVYEAMALVRLDGLEDRKPRELSGGQAQRVALARALAKRPKLLLLDEPMAALDRSLREHMRGELRRLHRALGTTFVLVTHDQDEALALADRVALLDRGRLAQVGTPEDLYERPASLDVARFVGRLNLLDGHVVQAGSGSGIEVTGLGRIRHDAAVALPVGSRVAIGIRPERIGFGPGENALRAAVTEVTYLGDQSIYRLALSEGAELQAVRPNGDGPGARPGDQVTVSWPSAAVLVFPEGPT